MLTKSKLVLSVAFAFGAASAAFAQPHSMSQQANFARHMSPHALNAYAEMTRPTRPFSWEEKLIFDRASRLF